MKETHNTSTTRTKIVATIGPASQHPAVLQKLVEAGLSVVRMNMSHGDYTTHAQTLDAVKKVRAKTGRPLPVLCDLCGPKIRIGDFSTESIMLKKGAQFIITTDSCVGDETRVSINYPTLHTEMKVGNMILLNDGKNALRVTGIKNKDIITEVVVGGAINGRRGVNLPGANLGIAALTAKDKKDVAWALQQDIDFFALSFVRYGKDILDLRKILKKYGSTIQIIAKIETPEALEHIDEIIELSDGIMVARGDLAVEIGFEKVPAAQKMLVAKCNSVGKPVIVATHMLESMTRAPVPTRAEVSDIANAVGDGADAVMLSEESATGQYPLEAVTTMSAVCREMEHMMTTHRRLLVRDHNLVDSVSSSIVHVAEDIDARALIALTESGSTARIISRFRPLQTIYAVTPHITTARQVFLSYGVEPLLMKKPTLLIKSARDIAKVLLKQKKIQKGDTMVLSAGIPFGMPGNTNTMMVYKIT